MATTRLPRGYLQAEILDEILRFGVHQAKKTGVPEFSMCAADIAAIIAPQFGPRTRAVCQAAINEAGLAARGMRLKSTDYSDGLERGARWFVIEFLKEHSDE